MLGRPMASQVLNYKDVISHATGQREAMQTFTMQLTRDAKGQRLAIRIEDWPFTFEDQADRRIFCGPCLRYPKRASGGEYLGPPLVGMLHVDPPDHEPRRLYAQLRHRIRVDDVPKPRPVFDGLNIYAEPSPIWWEDFRGERLARGEAVRCGRGHRLWLSLQSLGEALDTAEAASIQRDMYVFDEVPS